MKFILGLKLGMSQIFDEKGNVVPVTLIEAGPCIVTQIKTKEKDGYFAVQIGFGEAKKVTKAIAGHLKNLGKLLFLREFRTEAPKIDDKELKKGDKIDVSVFNEGDLVKVSGLSKGKGFAGVVKRWHFKGRPASHGTKHELRTPGSVGASQPERVIKGKKMPGRMGFERVTVKNLKIVKIDKENNLIAVKGAVPGAKGTLLEISSQ
ncbi:MAG: 50S ribosomal protein L3 [Patescibacteria group bacterium]|nr:50S ribosomal protein L3 [Patescibacteria group bacterium]